MAYISVTERIRWSDTDMAGIMYFGNYTRLFEIGEATLFEQAQLDYVQTIAEEYQAWMLRVAYHCEFHSPVLLGDTVRIDIGISNLGGASMTLSFRVVRHEDTTLLGSGYCTIVMADRMTRKPKRIPDPMRTALAPYCIEEHL
jgi:acyl-CoA thioester hydrolase